MNTNEQRYIIEGLHHGNQANHAIADAIASKSAKMLDEALQDNFETILQAKLSQAVNETLAIHADRASKFAKKFLGTSKTQLAQNLVDTQHNHQLASLQSHLKLDELEAFDTSLDAEVARLADEAGTITFQIDETSSVGF